MNDEQKKPWEFWQPCPDGCGFSHRKTDTDPKHNPSWLQRRLNEIESEFVGVFKQIVPEAMNKDPKSRRLFKILSSHPKIAGLLK